MKKFIYISFFVAITALVWGCQEYDPTDSVDVDDETSSSVTVLEDGQLLVTGQLSMSDFGEVSVASRSTDCETNIANGWCLIFGADATEQLKGTAATYTDDSPLIQKMPITVNANGRFFVTLTPYEGVAFLRIVVNLTTRENNALSSVVCWADCDGATSDKDLDLDGQYELCVSVPSDADINGATIDGTAVSLGTFGEYRYQSVGLDGIYNFSDGYSTTIATNEDGSYQTETTVNGITSLVYDDLNTVSPDPHDVSTAFPMSSVGFVLSDGITIETVADMFDKTIYLVRACSKVDVTVSDSGFQLSAVYLINCAQEARVRSTVLSSSGTSGNETSTSFDIPVDLGGVINYLPLSYSTALTQGATTDPIYFYPNAGGEYDSDQTVSSVVNNEINPQYVIIKGRAAGYDTDGYYKIALKAQYPLEYNYDDNNEPILDDVLVWSDLTYDIIRNTHFNINLSNIEKPGYLTFADAESDNNPANNISYSITVNGENSNNEFLISKGTYFVELEGSRVYVKGYGGDGIEGCKIEFTLNPSSGNYTPNTYLRTSGGVEITKVSKTIGDDTDEVEKDETSIYDDAYSYTIDTSNVDVKVVVEFSALSSGRLRLRIGDILKYIPVLVEEAEVDIAEGMLSFIQEPETKFNYSQIFSENDASYTLNDEEIELILKSTGVVTENTDYDNAREVRSTLYTDSGVTKLYFKQHAADSDAKVDGVNLIPLQDLLDDENGGAASAEDIDELTDAIISAIVDEGKTTIYLDGYYLNALFSDGEEGDNSSPDTVKDNITIFEDVRNAIAEAIAENKLDADFTYSLDLSNITRADGQAENIMSPFAKISSYYFAGDIYLVSLILPSSVNWIGGGAFSGCSNLKTVVIGNENDLADIDQLDANSFSGMADDATITIYNQHDLSDYLESSNLITNGKATYTEQVLYNTDSTISGYKYVLTYTNLE